MDSAIAQSLEAKILCELFQFLLDEIRIGVNSKLEIWWDALEYKRF